MNTVLNLPLVHHSKIRIGQVRELGELVGFETRNKYRIEDGGGQQIGFAFEERGWAGFLLRQFFGHWRSFKILVFNQHRQQLYTIIHPFRFYFQKVELETASGQPIGRMERRFSFFTKSFDVEDAQGNHLFSVRSPIWKIWTFPFVRGSRERAFVRKRWAGTLTEIFMDADRFEIEFADPSLTQSERELIMAAGIFIDIRYFENKAK